MDRSSLSRRVKPSNYVVATGWLDGKHVVFGRVSSGESVVKAVEKEGTNAGQPRRRVVIAKCSVKRL